MLVLRDPRPSVSPTGRVSRRTWLQAGGAGLFGLNLPGLLRAEQTRPAGDGIASAFGRAKSVIFLFLFGGPAQHETFDMKPDAADTIRGPFRPIACRTPGLRISEHLPRTAACSDRYCVVRTVSHSYNDHSGGGHYVQTGHRWTIPVGGGFNATPQDWPSLGSVVEHLGQQGRIPVRSELPSYVVAPNSLGRLQEFKTLLRRPGEYAGWLGSGCDALTTAIDKRDAKDNPYWRNVSDAELTFQIQGLARSTELPAQRLDRRRALLDRFDDARRLLDTHPQVATYDRFRDRALSLVTSDRTRAAFDVTREPAALRDRYGRHLFGQSTLLARRLVEAGVRFVTVHYDCVDGYSWDSHVQSNDLRDHLLPTLDQALSALLGDLSERGLLDETLVVCLGEMGRTPKITAAGGRQHWSTLFPALFAGAGVAGGRVVGESDRDAAYALAPPFSPDDLGATVLASLGIDPETRIADPQGRPVPLIDGGHPIAALFG